MKRSHLISLALFGWLLVVGFMPFLGRAEDAIPFTPQVSIPGTNFVANQTVNITPTTLAEYIKGLYSFGVVAATIVAVIVVMYGGFLWLMAGGNSSQVKSAQSWITGAITGLTLLLMSWLLLQTINPALVELRGLNPEIIKKIDLPRTAQFCCVCRRDTSAPAVENKCSDVSVIVPGHCNCPNSNPVAAGSASECAQGCTFTSDTDEQQRQVAQSDCQRQGLGQLCTVLSTMGSCVGQTQCREAMAAQHQTGPCATDVECGGGSVCNGGWKCESNNPNDLGVQRAQGAEAGGGVVGPLVYKTACCRSLARQGEVCVKDNDCSSGLHCPDSRTLSSIRGSVVNTCQPKAN